jgi:hypothetical protein
MKANEDQGRFTEHAHGLGTVTEEMVNQRAVEIAIVNGRSSANVLETDREQARRELTGAAGLAASPTKAEQLDEEQRWTAVPESKGSKTPTVNASDEQSFAEELVEEGIADAEHDQMVRATRESLKRDAEE